MQKKNKNKMKKNKSNLSKEEEYVTQMSDERLRAYGLNPKKTKKKIKYAKKN